MYDRPYLKCIAQSQSKRLLLLLLPYCKIIWLTCYFLQTVRISWLDSDSWNGQDEVGFVLEYISVRIVHQPPLKSPLLFTFGLILAVAFT
jgi:hypothetical protein